jgi:hypothetical protein
VPSQKCWVSGVGFGLARAGSAIGKFSRDCRFADFGGFCRSGFAMRAGKCQICEIRFRI